MASPDREKWLDVFDTPYSNGANTAANGLFLGLICLSLVGCVVISWRKQRFIPFSFVLCVAYIFEIIAYALRFQGWDFTTFSVQFGLSTIAPVFVTMAIHLATAEVISQLGADHAPLSPSAHLRSFIWTDIACLCIQALGLSLTFSGARAAGPWGLMLPKRAHIGQAILFAGLLIQTLALAAALAVVAITYVRASKADRTRGYSTFQRGGPTTVPLSPRFKLFLAALSLAGACVLVRCAYRTAAAWGGIGSPIAKDLLLWVVVEGALLTEAMVSLSAFHPALCLDDVGGGSTRTQDLEAGRQEVIGKRYSSGTTMSMGDMYERKMHDPQQHLGEGSQLMFSSNVMAPSEAGSSDAAGSRRGSAGVLDANPYYRYEDPFAGSPSPSPSPRDRSPYDAHYSEDITAESRRLSPMEAEAEEDRYETESFVQPPRKSSKRQSRILSLTEAELAAEAADYVDDESFVMPPRKSSKRVQPARGLSVRSDDDQLEVASFVLPSRKPSKMSTMHGDEDLDAVSLYSQ
ncbi:hypothetical protein N0V93_003379 [Gnomoniopsis smithogilvyi]|uniref:Uncharacterized protein n=1 Tax=Gnomoniopsis smithogilvyi TaxID=1191159 RepID=A0A9W8Z0B3_9PEZI|nr:hypothetical protein N0V93_003379 [Gnomoniopsis smithogilvyi]